MRYNVGDTVVVRSDLLEGQRYNGYGCLFYMTKFAGQTVAITEVYDNFYHFKEDSVGYNWTDGMIDHEATQMQHGISSVDVIQWLGVHANDGSYTKVFGYECTIDVLVKLLTPEEIIRRITEYEGSKVA